jgi:predicted porin
LFNLGDFYMKKTLVALAVIAASGASFAQVTISGKLGFSYQKNATVGGGSANHGMAMADGDLNFAAAEDLGGGWKAEAKSAFASRGRDNTFAPRNATLGLTTSVGLLTLGSVESCSTILNTAGAPVSLSTGHDGGTDANKISKNDTTPIDRCVNIDIAQFNIPVGPVTLGVAYIDSIGTAGAGAGNVTANLVSASFASGALSAGVDHTVFAGDAAIVGLIGSYIKDLTRTRLTVAYDLGIAKLGAGFQTNNNSKASQSSVSVNVPMGAVQVGLVHSMRNAQDAVNGLLADDSRNATAIGVQYDLSKMTNLNFSYSTYSNTKALENEFRIRLMKSF